MPLHLDWITNPADAVNTRSVLVQVGLELGGDTEPAISDLAAGTEGRVRIFEVRGAVGGRGTGETALPRLIATFHGNLHRTTSTTVPANRRLTFELFGTRNDHSTEGEVLGFDPECIMGVDALIMTFVNRQFVIFFPFLVDTQTEGDFLEFEATAEIGTLQAPTILARSTHVLTIPVRRFSPVQTTTATTPPQIYTGRVIGNAICHHENYLVVSGNGRVPVAAAGRAIPGGAGRNAPIQISFQAYVASSLRIVITDDLFSGLMPPRSFLRKEFPGFTDAAVDALLATTRTRVENRVNTVMTNAFVEAGFLGTTVLVPANPATPALMTLYRAVFTRRRNNWELITPNTFLSIPFFTYFVADGTAGMPPNGVGLSEGTGLFTTQVAGRSLDLEGPLPVASGNKSIARPIQVNTGQLAGILTTNHYKTLADYNLAVDNMAGLVAAVSAHEIGHSLGLMHDMKCNRVGQTGPFSESSARELLDIMCSNADESPRDLGFGFSNQVKVIWQNAFATAPVIDVSPAFLRNKTWGPTATPAGPVDEFRTLKFIDRYKRFFGLHGQAVVVKPVMVDPLATPPFTGTGAAGQKGTFSP